MRTANFMRMMVLPLSLFAYQSSSADGQPPRFKEIHWVHSSEKALDLAQPSKSPILIYVTSDNCGYCRKMDRDVWSHPQIIQMVEERYIPFKLDAAKNAELVAMLNIQSLPTTLLFSSKAEFLASKTGFVPATQMAGMLRMLETPSLVGQVGR